MEQKPWYHSKTIWVNALMMAGIAFQMVTGAVLADAEEQGAFIIVVNMILRAITKSGLTATK